ncbi:MAG: hypothetical protein JWR68_3262 [Polaromonas sp.]|nr:hypothetical protein [Polaromonas sp.]
MNEWTAIASGLSMLVGLMLGAWVSAWRAQRKASAKLSVPERWPLRPRRIVNGNEKEVWASLCASFHDHVVLVKVPVLRYTRLHDIEKFSVNAKAMAQAHAENERLQDLLAGLYTTFTVCTADGKVMGCVDVSGSTLTKANRELKEALLLECDIAYTVVSAFNIPDASDLRALFLGEILIEPEDHQITRGGDSDFHAELSSFTKLQSSGAGNYGADFV